MTLVQTISVVFTVLIIPWAVQLIKNQAITGKAAMGLSFLLSLAAGLIAGFLTGIPTDPAQWVGFIFAIFGGVQGAYMTFKSVGFTNKWLEALLHVDLTEGK